MQYGVKILENAKSGARRKLGELKFRTGKTLKLNVNEVQEFESWVQSRIRDPSDMLLHDSAKRPPIKKPRWR